MAKGCGFWNNDSYKIYMSAASNSTWGGRVTGETTSDYNMYFRMNGGTNRGFVFRSGNTNHSNIDASGNARFYGEVVAGTNGSQATVKARYNGTDSYHGALGWNYLQLGNNGTNRINAGRTSTGGHLDIHTNVTGTNTGGTHAARFDTAGNVYSYGSSRSPIFYDSNNSGYYAHLDGSSNLNNISANTTTLGKIKFKGEGTNSNQTNDRYAIYQEAGAWSNPFPDLIIGYHTGIKIGGYYGYGGTRFYNDNPTNGTEIFSVGNGDNNIRATNDLILTQTAGSRRLVMGNQDSAGVNKPSIMAAANGILYWGKGNTWSGNGGTFTEYGQVNSDYLSHTSDIRAPIFYDSNNTGFYVDPASTSKLSTLAVTNIYDAATNGGRATMYMDGNFHLDAKGSNDIFANYYSGRRFRTFYGSQSESFRTDTDGIVYAYNQFRTPIIYDYNNTGFHCDPAHISAFSTIKADDVAPKNAIMEFTGVANGSFSFTNPSGGSAHYTARGNRVLTSNSSGWHQDGEDPTIAIVDSHTGTDIDSAGIGLIMHNEANTTNAYSPGMMWTARSTSNNYDSMYAAVYGRKTNTGPDTNWNAGELHFFTVASSNYVTSTPDLRLADHGDAFVKTSVRAPIFYDKDNTANYFDPNTTSAVNQINLNRLVITSGDIRSNASSSWTGNPGAQGKIQYHSNRWYIVGDSSSNRIVQFRRDASDKSYIDNDGRLLNQPDARAPIYYDSNNTAYSLDLDSASNDANIFRGGARFGPNTSWSEYLAVGTNGNISNRATVATTNGNLHLDSKSSSHGLYLNHYSNGPVYYKNVLYDGTNTAYYTQNHSTSLFNFIRVNSLTVGSTSAMSSAGNIAVHSSGNPYISFHSGTTARTGYLQHLTDSDRFYFGDVSFTQSAGSFRAPVFYDTDNTGYYSDNASTSRFNVIHSNNYKTEAGDGRGIGFWNGAGGSAYSIFMSSATNGTYGGRVAGETTSDYNMYFRMQGGTNRGWVFTSGAANPVAGIDASGFGYFEGTVKTNTSSAARVGLEVHRGSSTGNWAEFFYGGSKKANLGYNVPYGSRFHIGFDTGSFGLQFYNFSSAMYIAPSNADGSNKDNLVDLGSSGARFDDVYATNGSIQTSDRNEKQDIQELTDAETRVATACKGLIRRYRWISSVEEKGDDARYHFGAIAQDVEAAFSAEGLDAGDYGLFIRNNWWEYDGASYPTQEEAPTGAVEMTRLGIRYNQLFAFIISAL